MEIYHWLVIAIKPMNIETRNYQENHKDRALENKVGSKDVTYDKWLIW